MSAFADTPAPSRVLDGGQRLARLLAARETAVCMVFFAIVQQCLGHHNADNSWLIDVCEKWLDGARPYVDVIETNPPAAFLLYMPAVLLARLLHLPAEFVVSAFVFAGGLASVCFAAVIARAAGLARGAEAAIIVNAAIFALILTPGFSFAEREHVAGFAVLPMLAVYAARARGIAPEFGHALGAGLLAGLAMAIKPHFALAILLPLLFVVARRRSLAPAFVIENYSAAAVVLAYLAAIYLRFPDFFTVLPSLMDAYVPVREPLSDLLTEPWFLLNLALLGAVAGVMGLAGSDDRAVIVAAASAGFLGAYLVQGKGWVNHGLPGAALAFLALVIVFAPALAAGLDHPAWRKLRLIGMYVLAPAIIGMPILFGMIIQLTMKEEYPGLVDAVKRVGPPRPKLIAISGELDVGHPLVRRVGGEWVGRPHSLWLMLSARVLIAGKQGDAARLAAYIEEDASGFARDLRERKPDIVLVPKGDRVAEMLAHPVIAEVMRAYAPVETAGGVALWTPRR